MFNHNLSFFLYNLLIGGFYEKDYTPSYSFFDFMFF